VEERLVPRHFVWRVVAAAFLVVLVVGVAWMLWETREYVLVSFAGVLFAIFLRGLSERIQAMFPRLPAIASLGLVTAALLLIGALAVWALLPSLSAQANRLAEELPAAVTRLQDALAASSVGRSALPHLREIATDVFAQTSSLFGFTAHFAADFFVFFFVGIYVAADPQLYFEGVVSLFPEARRVRVSLLLLELQERMWAFVVGRVIAMTLIGILTAIGLAILGIPFALLNGFLTGLLSFLPIVGPLAAAIPVALLALLKSPLSVVYVGMLLGLVYTLDGYLISPMVQKRVGEVPMALTVASLMMAGILFGPLGMVLSLPMLVIVLVVVRTAYIEGMLGAAASKFYGGRGPDLVSRWESEKPCPPTPTVPARRAARAAPRTSTSSTE
jgi:predicted PurR-regulated permease PerM